jgi:DNA-binding FadR family transcriptional regulator
VYENRTCDTRKIVLCHMHDVACGDGTVPETVAEISGRVSHTRSTVYEAIRDLEAHGMIECDGYDDIRVS